MCENEIILKVLDLVGGAYCINMRNPERYNDITKAVKKYSGMYDRVVLDFYDVELDDPEKYDEFLNLVKQDKAVFRIYGDSKLKEKLEFIMSLVGCESKNRIDNVITKVELPNNKIAIKKDKMLELLENLFEVVDGVGYLKVADSLPEINKIATVEFIGDVIKDNRDKADKFFVDLIGVDVQDSAVEALSSVVVEARKLGIDLEIQTDNDKLNSLMNTYLSIRDNLRITIKRKIEIIDNLLSDRCVGMLTTYKTKGPADVFGRQGTAEPSSVLPAIYTGHDEEYLYFEVFSRKQYFTTHLDYQLRNGEVHPGLETIKKKVSIEQTGICSAYIGKMFHFNMPVQSSLKSNMSLYVQKEDIDDTSEINVDDSVENKSLLVSEYIKEVLDDWDIDYNKQELIETIDYVKLTVGK